MNTEEYIARLEHAVTMARRAEVERGKLPTSSITRNTWEMIAVAGDTLRHAAELVERMREERASS